MSKKVLGAVLVAAAVGLFATFATTASATPSKTSRCSGCHSGAGATITATLASTSGTNATYNVSAPGADYIAVFNPTTKVTQITGASGSFTVPVGVTYTLFAVTGPTTSDGLGQATVTPAAPAADTVAPVTTSDAKATYVSSAVIKLSATDAVGVAHTYYILNGAAQVEGATIDLSTVGSYTLEFWSVDAAGNAEAHKTVAFAITAPAPAPSVSVTIRSSVRTAREDRAFKLSGVVAPADAAGKLSLYVQKPGSSRWILVSAVKVGANGAWSINYTPRGHGTYKYQVRYVTATGTVVSRTISVSSRESNDD